MNQLLTEDRLAAGRERVANLAAASVPHPELLGQAATLRGKPAVMAFLKWAFCTGIWKTLMRQVFVTEEDTAVFNYRLRVGIADVVVFHVDGSATVIQVQDGASGFRSVLGGLGQLGLCAAQVDRAKALKGVRRALAWTPVVAPDGVNPIIERVSKDAGAIPVFLPALESLTTAVVRHQLDFVLQTLRDALRVENA